MPNENKDFDPTEIKEMLKKIGDDVKEEGSKALKLAGEGKEIAEGQKTRIDEMLVKQGELMGRLETAEQKLARRSKENEEGSKSLGQQLVENADFQNLVKSGRGVMKMNCKTVTNITNATTGTGAAGNTVRPDRVDGLLMPGLRQLRVRDLMSPGRTNSNLIEFVKESGYQQLAATQAGEAAAKAQSDIAFSLVQQAVVTIAHYVRASKQILNDTPMLESYIDTRLQYGLAFVEEAQLLLGSGATNNLNGIYTQATAYAQPSGGYGGGAIAINPIDTLRLMVLQAEIALYPVDGMVINNATWAYIETIKDTQGRYIVGDPKNPIQPSLWGRPVVPSLTMANGTALVGAFKMASQVFDREDANVTVSTEDATNFTTNLVTVLAEERLASAVFRPEAFIKATALPQAGV
jgi:HK97 family phage major capsid protein